MQAVKSHPNSSNPPVEDLTSTARALSGVSQGKPRLPYEITEDRPDQTGARPLPASTLGRHPFLLFFIARPFAVNCYQVCLSLLRI